jgi:hypothetical protein
VPLPRPLAPPSVPVEPDDDSDEPEPSAGSVVVTCTWSPAFTPLTIWVRLSPTSPTTTVVGTALPLWSRLTRPTEPVLVTALLGRLTPDAWPVTTAADALIPGLTRESRWSSVSVAS